MIGAKAGDLVVVTVRHGVEIHRVWGHKGPHVLTAPVDAPGPHAAGGSAYKWSRKTGRRSGGDAWLLRLATEQDLADYELAVATRIARRRVERRSTEAAVEAILEAAEQLHWLTGGEE